MKAKLPFICKTALVALCALTLGPATLFARDASKAVNQSGLIKLVDNSGQQIIVTQHKTRAEGTFKWNDQTKFIEHGKRVTASALKVGMPVHLSYLAKSGTPTLERVKLTPPKEHKHSSVPGSSRRIG